MTHSATSGAIVSRRVRASMASHHHHCSLSFIYIHTHGTRSIALVSFHAAAAPYWCVCVIESRHLPLFNDPYLVDIVWSLDDWRLIPPEVSVIFFVAFKTLYNRLHSLSLYIYRLFCRLLLYPTKEKSAQETHVDFLYRST